MTSKHYQHCCYDYYHSNKLRANALQASDLETWKIEYAFRVLRCVRCVAHSAEFPAMANICEQE